MTKRTKKEVRLDMSEAEFQALQSDAWSRGYTAAMKETVATPPREVKKPITSVEDVSRELVALARIYMNWQMMAARDVGVALSSAEPAMQFIAMARSAVSGKVLSVSNFIDVSVINADSKS